MAEPSGRPLTPANGLSWHGTPAYPPNPTPIPEGAPVWMLGDATRALTHTREGASATRTPLPEPTTHDPEARSTP